MSNFDPNRVPRPVFREIEPLDRFKRMLLGLPIHVSRAMIPWGYTRDPLYRQHLLPDVNALRLLLKAREYVKTCSLDEVATWLSAETKMSLSKEGLRAVLIERTPFKEIMLPDDERDRLFYSPTKHVPDEKEK